MTAHLFQLRGGEKFDCIECGRHVYRAIKSTDLLCGDCIMVPGWFRIPDLCAVFDSDNRRRPPEIEKFEAPSYPAKCSIHCTVCEGADHHWLPDCDEETGHPVELCKHCEARRPYRGEDDEALS